MRILVFSKATGIDPLLLTQTAMTEYMPETWKVLAMTAVPVQEVQLNIRAPSPVVERSNALTAGQLGVKHRSGRFSPSNRSKTQNVATIQTPVGRRDRKQ